MVAKNKAFRNGGGVTVLDSQDVQFYHVNIEENESLMNGGGIYLENTQNLEF